MVQNNVDFQFIPSFVLLITNIMTKGSPRGDFNICHWGNNPFSGSDMMPQPHLLVG